MDGREFEVLTDVVGMLLSQGPGVESVNSEAKLLLEVSAQGSGGVSGGGSAAASTHGGGRGGGGGGGGGSEEGEEQDVGVAAAQAYALLRQQLWELRAGALELRAALGGPLHRHVCQLGIGGGGGGEGVEDAHLQVHHFLPGEGAEVGGTPQFTTQAELLAALRGHLALAAAAAAAASSTMGGSGGGSRGAVASAAAAPPAASPPPPWRLQRAQALLLQWVEEQEGGAELALAKARGALLAIRASGRGKERRRRQAARLLLQVGGGWGGAG